VEGARQVIKVVDVCSTSGHTTSSTPGTMILPPITVARERGLARAGGWLAPIGVVAGVTIDCFPDRYAALADAQPNQVILLTPGQDIRGHISAGPLADNSRTRALRVRLG